MLTVAEADCSVGGRKVRRTAHQQWSASVHQDDWSPPGQQRSAIRRWRNAAEVRALNEPRAVLVFMVEKRSIPADGIFDFLRIENRREMNGVPDVGPMDCWGLSDSF